MNKTIDIDKSKKANLSDLIDLINKISKLEKKYEFSKMIKGINQYETVTPNQALWIMQLVWKHSIPYNPNPLFGKVNLQGKYCQDTIRYMQHEQMYVLRMLLTDEQANKANSLNIGIYKYRYI